MHGDVLVREGTMSRELLFLFNGVVDVTAVIRVAVPSQAPPTPDGNSTPNRQVGRCASSAATDTCPGAGGVS
jgi:hypothetical protein